MAAKPNTATTNTTDIQRMPMMYMASPKKAPARAACHQFGAGSASRVSAATLMISTGHHPTGAKPSEPAAPARAASELRAHHGRSRRRLVTLGMVPRRSQLTERDGP